MVGLVLVSVACPALASEPVVAVVEATTNIAPSSIRPEIKPAAAQGVRLAGGRSVQAPASGEADCASPGCMPSVAKANGADYVLRVDAVYANDGFKLVLEVFDGKTGRKLGNGIRDCDVCTGPEFLKAIKETSLKVSSDALAAPFEPAMSSVPAVAPPLPATTSAQPQPPVVPPLHQSPSHLRKASWITLAAGGAVALTGAAFLATDGRESDCRQTATAGEQCWKVVDNKARGWAMVGIGGALAVAGGIMFVMSRPSAAREIAVGVGPGALTVGGTF